MEYRAQGDRKQFQRDVIPELETMRKNSFTSGRVFGDISEAEMKGQAISLVKKLTDSEIENLVDKAGFDEDYAYVLKAKLKGRRQFLIKRFKIEEENRERPMPVGRERVAKALDRISNTEREKLENIGFNPRVSLLADTDYIENQQIDIIEQEGQYVVQFKINQAKLDDAKSAIIDYCRYARCEEGLIQYVDMRVDKLGQLDFLIGNAKVTALSDDAWVKVSRGEKRSSVGLVQIEIKKGEDPVKTKELIGTYIDQAFSQIFDKKEALLPPPPESTTDYMLNRRAWLWKRQPGELKDEEVQEVLATSKRAEVFPNYWTVVEEGAHLKYWDEHGPYAIFHKIFSLARLPLMIKSGGLLSSHERFRRGLLIAGESSSSDFQYGGADSVFVRTAVEQAINNGKKQKRFTSAISGSPCLIFSPEIFDRTDWYAYEGDNYGSTEPDKFNRRQTPGELFSEQKDKYYSSSNEQMFRLGIPFEHVIGISCSVDDRDEIIELLKSNGINEINNQPIEEFVVVATNELEVIEVTKKYMAGNKSKKYEEYEVTQEDMEYKRKGKRPNKL
ncbi:MAG: hypothetical protein HYZ69_00950 [Candidatus Colwellbacteria bacterium]|nr:hypothetical protein [Candidatus Colwellbacteria bacterium]